MRKTSFAIFAVLLVASMMLASCAPAAAPTPQTIVQTVVVEKPVIQTQQVIVQATAAPTVPSAVNYARNETLYTSGTQYGPPSSWNPFNGGGYAMGTVGLVYETLFIYDPLADKFTPWLAAQDMAWTDPTTLEIKLRDGLTWSDGKPLTADDVKFSYELADPNGKYKVGLAYTGLWNSLTSINKVDNLTLDFKFNANPPYQEVGFYLWQVPIVPASIWSSMAVKDITGGANENPVGSGPYLAESHDQDRMVWVRNDNWWGIKAFSKTPAPKRIVDIVNGSNNAALGMFLQGGLDLSNNFLPGISTLVTNGGYGVQTYFPKAPYMLSANVAALIINEQKPPMNDVKFRQAMAYAIDVNDIVQNDYTNIVQAADPSGLLPIWSKYIDQAQVKKLGWKYDPAKAVQILTAAGYKKGSDGFFQTPKGDPIALKITCPSGWTDWMAAIQIMSKNFQAVGLNITPDYPDYGPWRDAQLKGTFDLSIQNEAQMSSTPWSYYKWVFQNPIANVATAQYGNYGRYDNKDAFALVDQMDQVKVGDDAAMSAIASKLQAITMTEFPTIPLWYNGLWSQYSNANWTNWPSSADASNHFMPATWRGYWNMSAIQMLLDLKPAPAK